MSDGSKTPGQSVLGWWGRNIGDREIPTARALSARLRRAVSPIDVLAEPAVHDLSRVLDLRDAARLVRLVQVLAEVREHTSRTLAQRMGTDDPPALSSLRFQRLIRAEDEALTTALRRALPLVDRTCNVAALGQDLLFWNEPTRARWCFHYFGAAAPQSLSEEVSE